jgi:predicted nucleic-acid-binding Zn-ribbon protein
MSGKAVLADVDGRQLACLICGAVEFTERPVKLNTTGAEFFGIEWANRTATALICKNCGYVHEFFGGTLELYDV